MCWEFGGVCRVVGSIMLPGLSDAMVLWLIRDVQKNSFRRYFINTPRRVEGQND